MDPKKLADEILEQLFPQNEELFEEKDEEEGEEEDSLHLFVFINSK